MTAVAEAVVETQAAPVETLKPSEVTSTEAPDGAAVVESKPAEAKVEDKETDNLARRFAILSKKERKQIERESALKAKEEEIRRREEEFSLFEKDPYGFLEKKGITYEQWTKKLLSGEESKVSDEVKSLRSEIEKLRQEREAELSKVRESQAHAAWNSHKEKIKNIVESKEDFEFLKTEGENGIDTILNYMVDVNAKTGKPPTYEEACQAVESYLEKKAENFRKLKKVQKWFQPPEAPAPIESPKQSTGNQQRPTTLTNEMSTQGSKPVAGRKNLSREESLREAAKLIRFID